ncbi:unnamed protein product [Lactuca virosa]|uniref:Uncharacterized protein n=1 Tax=Lactuca virosa TaxID=75947 RepID=A0AAU9LR00_9ASTR|nr:unnamed protein product [Lactuca virosa]
MYRRNKEIKYVTVALPRKPPSETYKYHDHHIILHSLPSSPTTSYHMKRLFDPLYLKSQKWTLELDRDTTRSRPECEVGNEESGGSSKRSKTTEEGEYCVHSNPETPTSDCSTVKRPTGRDAAKKKGKNGKHGLFKIIDNSMKSSLNYSYKIIIPEQEGGIAIENVSRVRHV